MAVPGSSPGTAVTTAKAAAGGRTYDMKDERTPAKKHDTCA